MSILFSGSNRVFRRWSKNIDIKVKEKAATRAAGVKITIS